ELRQARCGNGRRVAVPALLRGGELGRARRVHRPLGRRVLGLARADEPHRPPPATRVHDALVRVSGAGRDRRGEPRAAGPALFRALPRSRRAVPVTRLLDLGRADGVVRRDDRPGSGVQCRRTPGTAAARARVPAAERGSPLARRQGSSRHRSPSKSDVTQAEPAASATASGLWPTGIVRTTPFVAGSTTETVLSSMFGTHRRPPTHVLASGFAPTVTTARTASDTGSTR